MAAALEKLPPLNDPRVIVGYNTADDAGVIRINDDLALVHTVDFFTPIVDDPYQYGLIAAANSLSDIYAMGAVPFSGLNIIGFPKNLFPVEVLIEILQGGSDKMAEAGAIIVGGHSISDDELKYGLAVTGFVHPEKVLTNAEAKPGDLLILTKPIGTGTITTALKAGKGSEEMEENVCKIMAQLNKTASEICVKTEVHALTDITGFGLVGHAFEVAKASNVNITFEYDKIPIIPDALLTAEKGFVPGGTKANRLYVGSNMVMDDRFGKLEENILFDPQTSGGLLISISEDKAGEISTRLSDAGIFAPVIGFVKAGNPGKIFVK